MDLAEQTLFLYIFIRKVGSRSPKHVVNKHPLSSVECILDSLLLLQCFTSPVYF
jgi:hypothetical protein